MVDQTPLACASQKVARVVENVPIARDTFRLRLDDPVTARLIRPGQFVMIRPSAGSDPLLGRPFALYDVVRDGSGEPIGFDVVYLILGRGTAVLATRRPGDLLSTWGPLGNGFGPPPSEGSAVLVAGGIGQTPFLALAKWWLGRAPYGISGSPPGPIAKSAILLYGARSSSFLAGLEDFRLAGVDVDIATDDGSAGHRGYVTELLRQRLERGDRPAKVVGCGPPPMLQTLAKILADHDLDGDLSLENHMACGFGACFSCVAPILQEDGSTDLRRVCVEGPVFPARTVVWNPA